jgi:hypothetical protein
MFAEPQYQTFDQLLDSVRVDFKTYDLENAFDPQQLIKMVIKINYELGLKINPSRSKIIEVRKGRARLPLDFSVLNFALVCQERYAHTAPQDDKSYHEGLLEGIVTAQRLLEDNHVNQFVTTLDIVPGNNTVPHNLNTKDFIVRATDEEGNDLSFLTINPDADKVTIRSEAEVTVENVKLVLIGAKGSTVKLEGVSAELSRQEHGLTVRYYNYDTEYRFHRLEQLKLQRNKGIAPDCWNLYSQSRLSGHLQNGFLITNFEEGQVFLNYQGVLEDDAGNLLVLDHPFVNDYYEYALKERVLENLLMNGEDVAQKLQYIQSKLRPARAMAMSFINTPDFSTLRQMWELNRKAQHHNYYNMFKS